MYDKSQATGIFTAAQSGLQTTLQYLYNNNTKGITRDALNKAYTNNNSGINNTFFQMVSSQFSTLDKNNDGKLTADEANTMLTDLSSGVTREQITQLVAAGTIDKDLANKIISNFSKIDTNGDGKVSEAEINAYCMDEDIQSKKDEQKELLIKNMSCYYEVDTDDTSSDEV
ncbi:MAG: EF-hand domain-containing protein [bacterium]|nr:EF-hand domain-containing protein [bacterium]